MQYLSRFTILYYILINSLYNFQFAYSSHLYDLATIEVDEVFVSEIVFEAEPSWEVDGSISSVCANSLVK